MSPPEPPSAALIRHLPTLFERLRTARYTVGPGEVVDCQRLLARAACHGQGPAEASALARLLAPVVCRSPAEQQAFGDHFQTWLAELPVSRQVTESVSRRRIRKAPAPTAPGPEARLAVQVWRLTAALLVIVALAFLASWWVLTQFLPADTTPAMRTRSAQVPAAGGWPAPARPRVMGVGNEVHFWPLAFAVSLWLVPLYYAWLYGGLLPAWLTGRSATRLPELDRLSLGRPVRPVGAAWHGIQSLCDRDQRPDHGLEVEATVRATASRGGYFTPIHGRRPELPEYLALIDRQSPADHLARFAEELVARLEERGLATRSLFFRRDPRSGVGGREHGFSSLAALSNQARDERLLVFSDAVSWLDPRNGRPWPALESITHWRQRFLLTPRPEPEWGRREQTLAAGWLAPFPLDDQGLVALAECCAARVTQTATAPSPAVAGTAAIPDQSGTAPPAWDEEAERRLEDAPPEPLQIQQLVATLEQRLPPDDFRWLRACAVFPAVSWPVTCYLGQHLSDDSKQPQLTEERLLRLARLPWFRHGTMPDWLRLELIDGMDRGERATVRESLRRLLIEAVRATKPGGGPKIAQMSGWRSDRWLTRFLAGQEAHSTLREDLFLTFMRGRRPWRLTLVVPRQLRALIRDVDRWSVLASAILAAVGTLAIAVWHRLESLPLAAGPRFDDGVRVLPMPAAAALPEATIVAAILALSVLVVGRYGLRLEHRPPTAAEAAVPGLIARISAHRLPVLIPWIATAWVTAFIFADFAGSPAVLRWIAAHLVALLTLGLYVYLELRFSSDDRRRLTGLEARLDAGAGAEIVSELAAFLRGRAAAVMKRRLLRRLHARARQPTPELISALFELRHNDSLEPRIKSLLERIARDLEDRYRRRLEPGEAS